MRKTYNVKLWRLCDIPIEKRAQIPKRVYKADVQNFIEKMTELNLYVLFQPNGIVYVDTQRFQMR